MKEIKSIQVGDEGRFFFIKNAYNQSKIISIKEYWKNIGPGEVLVYRCYGEDNEILHEISANNSLTINYI